MQNRLYGHYQRQTSSYSRIFALDPSKSPLELIGRSNDSVTTSVFFGDSILRASMKGDRLFSVRGRFQLPSMELVGTPLGSDTRAISAYGHLRTSMVGIRDAVTDALIAEFPTQVSPYPRHSDFTMDQNAVVYFHPVHAAFELLPIPEAVRPPRIELVPTPADGGVLDYDLPVLWWTALPQVEGYRVFVGTDRAAVAVATDGSPEDRGVVETLEYRLDSTPPLGTVLFWRVDALRGGEPIIGEVFQARISPFRLAPSALSWRLPQGTSPQPFEVAVLGEGDNLLGWSASATVPWIAINASPGAAGTPLTGMIDPSGLAPGVHSGKVVITSEGETRELPVSLQINVLKLVKLGHDPARPLVYGLHTGNPIFDESQLVAIDAATGAILRVLAVGRNATDFEVDPVADRIFLNNLNSPVIRVVDLAEFSELDPLPAPTDISGIESDHGGRLFVQRSLTYFYGFDILDAESGAVLGNSGSKSAKGDRAELDPATGLYFVAQINSTYTMRIFDIRTNPPTYLDEIEQQTGSVLYPPLLSPDGGYLFWRHRSFRPPTTVLASLPGEAISTNPDGEIAVGESAIWWSDSGAVAANLPFASKVSAIDATGRYLVLFNSENATITSIELESLVALPGARPKPAATVPFDEFEGLSWGAKTGATAYRVYLGTSPSGVGAETPDPAVHLGTVVENRFDFDPPPAWGHRYYWRVDAVTASGVVRGEVSYFDIPFPPIGEPLTFALPAPATGILLDSGTALVATNGDGFASSYAISPADGTLSFDQHLGGVARNHSTTFSAVSVCGQGWILRARENATSSEQPPVAATWSRDPFLGHWHQRDPLMFPDPGEDGSTSFALAADGGHVLAGFARLGGVSPGRVVASIEWPQPQALGSFQADDVDESFGSVIAIEGNRALIGAHGHSSHPGSAYVFEFVPESANWEQRAKLQPSTSNSSYAGGVVALSGNFAALSAGLADRRLNPTRAVHLFQNMGAGWVLTQTLDNPSSSGNTIFGQAMAFHNDLLFVSQYRQGLISVYRLEGGQWLPSAPIQAPSGTRGFGFSLKARDGMLYVGCDEQIVTYRVQEDSNRRPRFPNPPPARLVAGRSAAVSIEAFDPDGAEGLVITAHALPNGLSLVDHGGGRATLTGIPIATRGERVFAQWSVSDPAGATNHQSCYIGLIGAEDRPVFERMPESADVGVGEPVSLRASVGDDEVVVWQWRKDDQPIEGATLPYLLIERAVMGDAGSYDVSATNEAGQTISTSAIVRVRPPNRDGGGWSTFGNSPARTGHHPATLGRVTFLPIWTRSLVVRRLLPQPVIADGRVFTGISGWNSGPLVALDLRTGEPLWRFPSEDSDNLPSGVSMFSSRGAPSWFDGRLYVQTHGDSLDGLHCLDAATGGLLWTTPMIAQHDAYSFPAVTEAGIFHCAGDAGGLYGVEADGTPRFFHVPPESPGGLASVHQGRVFTFTDGIVREHRPGGGSVVWSVAPETDLSGTGTLAVGEDSALVIVSGALVCIDTRTREVRWRVENQYTGVPAIYDGAVYAIRPQGVTACSLADGSIIKTFSTPQTAVASKQPLLLNDHLLVSGADTTWVFRLDSGELVHLIPADGGGLAYSAGHLLVTGNDGTLQCFFANGAPVFSAEVPRTADANAAADPMTIRLGPFVGDPDPDDLVRWSIVANSRPELFATIEIDPQSGDLTVGYNPWQSGASDVTLAAIDSVGNVTQTTITFTVPAHSDPQPEVADAIILNRQTGLYEHTITVTNTAARAVAGFELTITGLPEGVCVNNASDCTAGTAAVEYHAPLAVGASATLVLEYYAPIRGTVLAPHLAVALINTPDTDPVAPDGGIAVDRCIALPDGSALIEFAARPGAVYEVHYSEDGILWKLSPTRVRAAGSRVQWIDRGPPRTDTIPAGQPCRFYRVRETEADPQ
ncbi:MAG: PQQ-binding-like beta-propeller repeat protein [Verrucomicrobia bacterium]|nr:PQQ-binding-like beta-propeller repeat protein [Verrucomicrobiota bacterium]